MDTGAIMEQQMQDQIEAGIAMRDEFDEWFLKMQSAAFYMYGAGVSPEEQDNYFTYFKRGWLPDEVASDCFGFKPSDE